MENSLQQLNINIKKNEYYNSMEITNGACHAIVHSLTVEDLIKIHQTIGAYLANIAPK